MRFRRHAIIGGKRLDGIKCIRHGGPLRMVGAGFDLAEEPPPDGRLESPKTGFGAFMRLGHDSASNQIVTFNSEDGGAHSGSVVIETRDAKASGAGAIWTAMVDAALDAKR